MSPYPPFPVGSSSERRKVCPRCGDTFYNQGGHDERCMGPPPYSCCCRFWFGHSKIPHRRADAERKTAAPELGYSLGTRKPNGEGSPTTKSVGSEGTTAVDRAEARREQDGGGTPGSAPNAGQCHGTVYSRAWGRVACRLPAGHKGAHE